VFVKIWAATIGQIQKEKKEFFDGQKTKQKQIEK
jgi:hypothetical protein